MSAVLGCECISREYGFSYIHSTERESGRSVSHVDKDLFSIFMLLSGELDYVIEGNCLHIKPNDVVLVSNNELHHSIIKDGCECDYILLMLDLDFFIKNDCDDFTHVVFNRAMGSGNVIPAETVVSSGISDIFKRLDGYVMQSPVSLPVVKSVIIELLYNIDRQSAKSGRGGYQQKDVKKIIEYINQNLTERLTLDDIAAKFFLTKQYLCKVFKAATGITINKYVSYKRVVLVRELYSKGASLSEACEKAGFNDYSSFYRAYSKIMNEPPRKSLSKIDF